jgi:hypothetical protein
MTSPLKTTSRRAKIIAFLLLLAVLGSVFYEAWNYCGIYRLVLEWEISRSGNYVPKLGLAFAAVAYGGLVSFALAMAYRLGLIEGSSEGLIDLRRNSAAFVSQIAQFKYRLAFLLAGVALIFTGVADIAVARLAGNLMPASLANLESGGSPPGRWLQIEGKPLPEAAVGLTERRREKGEYYYPFVSADWKPGTPIGVVLLYDAPLAERETAVQAMIGLKRLPGVVRAEMEKAGYHFTSSVVVLEPKQTPDGFWFKGIGMLAMGFVVLVGNALVWWLRRPSRN